MKASSSPLTTSFGWCLRLPKRKPLNILNLLIELTSFVFQVQARKSTGSNLTVIADQDGGVNVFLRVE